jgi:GNAT superfamily N-acetyltransferase
MMRPVRQSDAAEVLQLLGQLWPEKHVDEAAVGATIGRYVREPQYWIYGYEVESVLRGLATVSLRWTLFHGGQVAILEDLVVDEGFRGQGIGTALLDFVEGRIVEEGRASVVEVNSDLHRDAAHDFWEKHGYSRLAYQSRKILA